MLIDAVSTTVGSGQFGAEGAKRAQVARIGATSHDLRLGVIPGNPAIRRKQRTQARVVLGNEVQWLCANHLDLPGLAERSRNARHDFVGGDARTKPHVKLGDNKSPS